jgi:diamine N-acetyltransferase
LNLNNRKIIPFFYIRDILSSLKKQMALIRNASIEDIPLIRSIADQTWWPTYSPILEKAQIEFMLSTIYSADAMQNAIISNEQTFILLENNGITEGFASYSPWKEDVTCWKIHKLYVLPLAQGKGYGRVFIGEISARATQNNVRTLVLNVNKHNPALSFYKKIGFTVLREEDIPIGPYWMNDYVMTLSI